VKRRRRGYEAEKALVATRGPSLFPAALPGMGVARPSFIDWSWGVAPRGLVAGRYQPLADGDARCCRVARPCPLPAVGSESEAKKAVSDLLRFDH